MHARVGGLDELVRVLHVGRLDGEGVDEHGAAVVRAGHRSDTRKDAEEEEKERGVRGDGGSDDGTSADQDEKRVRGNESDAEHSGRFDEDGSLAGSRTVRAEKIK